MAVFAADVGGTSTRVALDGTVVARFPTSPDYDHQLAALLATVRATGVTPAALGVSFGGRVTADGAVRVALNLRSYEGRPLGPDLAASLGCPVRVAHDATCGLLGEHAGGALRGADRCGYLTLSTGIGAALLLDSVALTTEAGHQLVPGNSRPCACGQVGCLETLLGGRALHRRLGRPLESLDDPSFWQRYAASLALGLANVALVAGVTTIALGGAIALRRPSLWPLLHAAVSERLTYQPLRVVPAALGEEAPLVGAAVLGSSPAVRVLH